MCTHWLFSQGLTSAKFHLDRVVRINHFWREKLGTLELPDCEDRIPLHSLVLTQYESVMDRQMDMPCCSIYSACS